MFITKLQCIVYTEKDQRPDHLGNVLLFNQTFISFKLNIILPKLYRADDIESTLTKAAATPQKRHSFNQTSVNKKARQTLKIINKLLLLGFINSRRNRLVVFLSIAELNIFKVKGKSTTARKEWCAHVLGIVSFSIVNAHSHTQYRK